MLVRVASYTNPVEAHLARGRLETERIPAFVIHEHHIWANWLMSLALQGVKIYVPPQYRERAKEIIVAHDRGAYALPDESPVHCRRCNGENIERRRVSWKAALLTTNLASVPIYFRWATLRCKQCGHEWDLPRTHVYPFFIIALAAGISIAAVLLLFAVGTCGPYPQLWLESMSCPFR